MKTVSILGTEYKVEIIQSKEDENLKGKDGYMDKTTKRIVVEDFKPEPGSVDDLEAYKRMVLRHEIIHAFLHESGLDTCSFAHNEEMVDYFALQAPKMIKAFREADAL